MEKIPGWDSRCADSIKEDVRSKCVEVFNSNWEQADKLISEFTSLRKLDKSLVLCVLRSEAFPLDGRKWAKSWLNLKHVDTLLSDLSIEEVEALGGVTFVEVMNLIKEWNDLSDAPAGKLTRLFGRQFSLKKVYFGGRYFRDVLVLAYWGRTKKMGLVPAIKEMLKKLKDVDTLTPPTVWKWNRNFVNGASLSTKFGEAQVLRFGEENV